MHRVFVTVLWGSGVCLVDEQIRKGVAIRVLSLTRYVVSSDRMSAFIGPPLECIVAHLGEVSSRSSRLSHIPRGVSPFPVLSSGENGT